MALDTTTDINGTEIQAPIVNNFMLALGGEQGDQQAAAFKRHFSQEFSTVLDPSKNPKETVH